VTSDVIAIQATCTDCGEESDLPLDADGELPAEGDTADLSACPACGNQEHEITDVPAMNPDRPSETSSSSGTPENEIENSVVCTACGCETYAYERFCRVCGHDRWSP